MDSTKKFQEAFDTLLKDFNNKVEEVKANIQHLSSDVKVQVDGQRENLQEYGEKIKGRLNQIVDVDKVRASVLAEAENLVDEAKVRIEKVFQFVNEHVNQGEKKAKKSATDFSKKAEKFTHEIEKDVRKISTKVEKNILKAEKKIESNVKKVANNVKANATKASKKLKSTATTATKNVKAVVKTAPATPKKAPAKAPTKKAVVKKKISK